MNDFIHMTGRLALFDKESVNGYLFPKDCEITIPEHVLVMWQEDVGDPTNVLGFGTVTRDDEGLSCDVDLFDFIRDELPIGGYYRTKGENREDGCFVVKKAELLAICLISDPINPDLKLVLKDRKEN